MSIEGQGNFFTIHFPGFVCGVLCAKISGESLQVEGVLPYMGVAAILVM